MWPWFSGHIFFMKELSTVKTKENISFSELGISPRILEVLERLNFLIPTPIQVKAIPIAIEGKDLIGIAQTGTGKTLAFGVPMLQRLAFMPAKKGIVVLPTRELALQVNDALQKIGRVFGLKTAVLIGGASMGEQINALRFNPHIIIGTPGRINDHLERRTLRLSEVAVLVLDEADRMLDMGFLPQIKKILESITAQHQTMLFSATMPDNILLIAKKYMKQPVHIEISRSGTLADTVEQELFIVRREQRTRLLNVLFSQYKGSVLVFSRTKHGASKICQAIKGMNHSASEIHSRKSLSERRRALDGFRAGTYRIMVATDIASRGIDVKNIELVINYDLPDDPSDYVHRIGRTGRAGLSGKAISFAAPDQKNKVREIERLIRTQLKVSKLPDLGPIGEPMPMYAGPRKEFSSHTKPFRKFQGHSNGKSAAKPAYHSYGSGGRQAGKKSHGSFRKKFNSF